MRQPVFYRPALCILSWIYLLLTTMGLSAQATEVEVDTLSLTFAGDIMAHPPNYRMSDYSRIYRAISSLLLDDDLSFGNLEFVIDPSRQMSGYPRFNVHTDYVTAAIDAGFDVFSMANNHSNDWGSAGAISSLRQTYLFKRYAAYVDRELHFSGLKMSSEDPVEFMYFDYGGRTIAFVAVAGVLNQYWSGAEQVNLVPFWDEDANNDLRMKISNARQHADLVIVSWHGGVEYQRMPADWKMDLFYSFAEAGADIVWGHHPHVIQPYEVTSTTDGRQAVIMYSMGNFISSQPTTLSPWDWYAVRAWTGDSIFLAVDVNFVENGARYQVEPIMITHLRSFAGDDPQRDGFEVVLTTQAMDISDETWKEFYRRRLAIMTEQVATYRDGSWVERVH